MPSKWFIVFGLTLTVLSFSTAAARVLEQWEFDVYLNDSKVGQHYYEIAEDNGAALIKTHAKFKVKLLFITAFKYAHENTERWQGDCLTQIQSKTNSNGKRLTVAGSASETAFTLQTADGAGELPGCVRSFAYWDLDLLQAEQLLNPQSGEYVDVDLSYKGVEMIDVGGEPVQAERYQLIAGDQDISLWYDEGGRWLGLEAQLKKSRVLRYVVSR
ncbi:MAG: DUF6134 family protein [Pseudomonadota bacterium]